MLDIEMVKQFYAAYSSKMPKKYSLLIFMMKHR